MDNLEYTRYVCYRVNTQEYVSGNTGVSFSKDPTKARLFVSPGKVSQSVGRRQIERGTFVIVPVEVKLDRMHLTVATLGGVIEGAELKPRRK